MKKVNELIEKLVDNHSLTLPERRLAIVALITLNKLRVEDPELISSMIGELSQEFKRKQDELNIVF